MCSCSICLGVSYHSSFSTCQFFVVNGHFRYFEICSNSMYWPPPSRLLLLCACLFSYWLDCFSGGYFSQYSVKLFILCCMDWGLGRSFLTVSFSVHTWPSSSTYCWLIIILFSTMTWSINCSTRLIQSSVCSFESIVYEVSVWVLFWFY